MPWRRARVGLRRMLHPAVLMPVLVGWSVVATMGWLAGRPSRAEPQSCPALQREVAHLRQSLDDSAAMVRFLAARLHGVALGNIREAEKALKGTGIKVDALIRRGRDDGAGGPFIPVPDAVQEDVERWDQLNRALKALPLGAPLRDYTISSGFGIRRDPLNRRRAWHNGIDLLAPVRTPVLATGPGVVVFAGRKGGFGRLVEIDHGLGVHTRYGHLARIRVKRGQHVALGQEVGQLGNSGRSTGPHLHYEIRVDGRARNPKPFLAAGLRLSGSAPPATDRLRRDIRAIPNSRARPSP